MSVFESSVSIQTSRSFSIPFASILDNAKRRRRFGNNRFCIDAIENAMISASPQLNAAALPPALQLISFVGHVAVKRFQRKSNFSAVVKLILRHRKSLEFFGDSQIFNHVARCSEVQIRCSENRGTHCLCGCIELWYCRVRRPRNFSSSVDPQSIIV